MQALTVHEYKIRIPGVTPKILYHFSDVHLNLRDAESSPDEQRQADDRARHWLNLRAEFARAYAEPYGAAQQRSAEQHLTSLLQLAETDGDALVIAGDAFDYINQAHLRYFQARFSALKVPCLYVCGNHEYDGEIPQDSAMASITRPVQVVDLGDLLIVGFNDAQRIITAQQLDCLRTCLAAQKPVIIVMHIPIQTENNAAMANCDDYFRINYPGAPAENLAFADLIRQSTDKVAAVLAGHLHFLNVCEISEGLTQYVSSQGITGHVNRYAIGE